MAESVKITKAPQSPTHAHQAAHKYAAVCAEHGWVTKWTGALITLKLAIVDHSRPHDCKPEIVCTPGKLWDRIPPLDPPKVRVPKANQVMYWARCSRCGWGTTKCKTPARPELWALGHRDKTHHYVEVLRSDTRTPNYVAGLVESHFSGERQEAMF